MSPAPSLHASLAAAAALARRYAATAVLALALCAVALLLTAGWLLGWDRPSPLPLLLDVLLVGAAFALFTYWRKVLRPRLDARHVAAATEQRHGLQAGALSGLLELEARVPEGTSAALVRREQRAVAARLSGHDPRSLAGDVGDGWARRARRLGAAAGVAGLALAALGFASPERSRNGWLPLLHPVQQLSRPPLPALSVLPGDVEVQRGAPLVVRAVAPAREAVLLRWRLEGDVVREQPLAVSGDSARGEIPAIAAAGEYWVEAPDGAHSPRYRIAVTDALLLSELRVDVVYPQYLGRAAEHYAGDVPLLELPAGTTLRLRGRATRELGSAALQGSRGTVLLEARGRSFEGRWVPTESGTYGWLLRDEEGGRAAVTPAPLEIVLVADQAPAVDVVFPGRDTIFTPELRQALAAEVRDDHGVAAAVLVSWRAGADGTRGERLETPLPLDGQPEHALLRTVLDASARGLAPGDTLNYFVRVLDGSPPRQSAVSPTYALRVPGAAELRARAAEEARAAVEQARELNQQAAELERQTRAAERTSQASNARRGSAGAGGGEAGQQPARMSFEETEQARRVAQQQESLNEQVQQLEAAVQSLEKSATEAGLQDPALQQRMEELQALVERLLTPELQRQLERLQQSVQQLSPQEMEQALERLAASQQELKAQLEQALKQLERAAAEQELNALAQEAKELSTQQEALAEEHAREKSAAESAERAEQQASLGERGEQLGGELERLGKELARQGEVEAAERTASAAAETRSAQERMEEAATSAAAQQGQEAAEQGKQAAEELRQAAQTLESARQDMASGSRREAEASMQQATRDALALAQRQQELQAQMERGQQQSQGGSSPPQPQPQAPAPQQGAQQEGSSQQPRPGQRQGQEQGSQRGGQQARQGGGALEGPQQGSGEGGGKAGGTSGQPQPDVASMRAEQAALQQGLQQLGRNLAETGQQSGMVSQEVSAALNRASTAMQQTQRGLEQAEQSGQLPAEQAAQAVDALNRLALALLANAQQVAQAQSAGGSAEAQQQLTEMARQQSSLNGQSSALQPLGLSPGSADEQLRRLGGEQQQIAQQLRGMSNLLGGREDAMGEVDALAREADALARELRGGRLPPEVRARQERLFHRLLDAGRSLEQEETSDERTAERPGATAGAAPIPLDARLLEGGDRYRVPTADELRALPPAYRRLILDYFERLNRPAPPGGR